MMQPWSPTYIADRDSESNVAVTTFISRSIAQVTWSCSARGMKKYALFLAASTSLRPDTKTAEHRIFANPDRPLTVGDPFGVSYESGDCHPGRAIAAAPTPAAPQRRSLVCRMVGRIRPSGDGGHVLIPAGGASLIQKELPMT